ncbi:MAG: hypothetical protein A4E64_00078 [Syntrophorhabdus sp. PtaU1.Bin058]|nr:MAG: hypothetical protein A4E64_00078 [Syntrophorhabdus sp. PtaU1.Bin058]
MEGFLRKGAVICLALVLTMSLSRICSSEEHTDDLLLTGFIKSYDANKGIIRIDVKSEGCTGLREFGIPEYAKDDLDPSLINQRIQFQIKSPTCERGRLYEMILKR